MAVQMLPRRAPRKPSAQVRDQPGLFSYAAFERVSYEAARAHLGLNASHRVRQRMGPVATQGLPPNWVNQLYAMARAHEGCARVKLEEGRVLICVTQAANARRR